MRFTDTRIAAFAHALPEERVTSEELEERLAPVYDRFRLRIGRLELMSGIRERRFWEPGTRPSQAATADSHQPSKRTGAASTSRAAAPAKRNTTARPMSSASDASPPNVASIEIGNPFTRGC